MKIFVISLQRSQERREKISAALNQQGVTFQFFDAVDGRAGEHELWAHYNYKKRLWLTSGRMPSKGELGCYASHYLLWQKCIELNEPVLVIEDDATINSFFGEHLDRITRLVNQYHFLRLEKETEKCRLHTALQGDVYSISFMSNNFGGTRSYVLTPTAARKLLKRSASWCMPVDNYIGSLYIHGMPSYLYEPSVVTNTEDFGTTIQLGEESEAPLYVKPTRELYSAYRRIRMKSTNRSIIKGLKN